jgi:putative PIN family toxin of toxin-antitoxin system
VIRAVIDSSVLVRYLIRPSAAIRELVEERWLGGQVQMVTAPELLTDLEMVLARPAMRRYVEPEEAQVLLDAIRALAELLPLLGAVPVFCRDPKDDIFVACALGGRADYLVTTDRDLLVLGVVEGVHMCAPHQLPAELAGRD